MRSERSKASLVISCGLTGVIAVVGGVAGYPRATAWFPGA